MMKSMSAAGGSIIKDQIVINCPNLIVQGFTVDGSWFAHELRYAPAGYSQQRWKSFMVGRWMIYFSKAEQKRCGRSSR